MHILNTELMVVAEMCMMYFSLKENRSMTANLIFDMIKFVWRWKLVDRVQDFDAWKISVFGLWQPGETHTGGEELPLVISVKCSVKIKSSLLFFVPIVYSTLQNVWKTQFLTAWILICLIAKSLLIQLCNKIFSALCLVRKNYFVSQ